MSYEFQSPDAESPFASVVAASPTQGYSYLAVRSDAPVTGRSGGGRKDPPNPPIRWPGQRPTDDTDPVWGWLRKAGSWLLKLAMEGFAEYGNAMYPGLAYSLQHDDVPPTPPHCAAADRQEDAIPVTSAACQGGMAARRVDLAGAKVALTTASRRGPRMIARLVKLSARWRHQREAKRQAALIRTFDDYLLRDIGVARDQIGALKAHEQHSK